MIFLLFVAKRKLFGLTGVQFNCGNSPFLVIIIIGSNTRKRRTTFLYGGQGFTANSFLAAPLPPLPGPNLFHLVTNPPWKASPYCTARWIS